MIKRSNLRSYADDEYKCAKLALLRPCPSGFVVIIVTIRGNPDAIIEGINNHVWSWREFLDCNAAKI
jgi:hypothetical protein